MAWLIDIVLEYIEVVPVRVSKIIINWDKQYKKFYDNKKSSEKRFCSAMLSVKFAPDAKNKKRKWHVQEIIACTKRAAIKCDIYEYQIRRWSA